MGVIRKWRTVNLEGVSMGQKNKTETVGNSHKRGIKTHDARLLYAQRQCGFFVAFLGDCGHVRVL